MKTTLFKWLKIANNLEIISSQFFEETHSDEDFNSFIETEQSIPPQLNKRISI